MARDSLNQFPRLDYAQPSTSKRPWRLMGVLIGISLGIAIGVLVLVVLVLVASFLLIHRHA